MSLNIIKINYNDKYILEQIFKWRNDELTRNNSINTNLISYEIFNKIINNYINDLNFV